MRICLYIMLSMAEDIYASAGSRGNSRPELRPGDDIASAMPRGQQLSRAARDGIMPSRTASRPGAGAGRKAWSSWSGAALSAVSSSPFLTGVSTLPPSSRPTGHGAVGAGLADGHGPGAVAGFADRIEGLAGSEVALGDGADLGDRPRQRHHVRPAIEHDARGGQRHFERGQVIGPEEAVVGTVTDMQIVHALDDARMLGLDDDEDAGRHALADGDNRRRPSSTGCRHPRAGSAPWPCRRGRPWGRACRARRARGRWRWRWRTSRPWSSSRRRTRPACAGSCCGAVLPRDSRPARRRD